MVIPDADSHYSIQIHPWLFQMLIVIVVYPDPSMVIPDADSHYSSPIHVSKGAKSRNRCNQVPHLTHDTNGKVTNSQKTPQTRAKR